jgi:hypothetical protein
VKLSAILGPLLDAKADHELIRKMVLAHEAEQADALERRRESDRRRQAAKAERDRKSRDSRERYDTVSSRARVEDKNSNLDIEPQEKNTPLSRLRAVVDEDRARSVVEHRQRLRKPLTARAAQLLAGDLAKCPDPNAAADEMVKRGWLGIDQKWLSNNARAGPPGNGKVKVADRASALAREMGEANEIRSSKNLDSVRPAVPNLLLVSG